MSVRRATVRRSRRRLAPGRLRPADLARAFARVDAVLVRGEPVHHDRRRRQTLGAHALGHLEAGPAGGVGEDHLGHALGRCAMAAQRALEEEPQ